MAKSSRSKEKLRLRACKRQKLIETVINKEIEKHHTALLDNQQGILANHTIPASGFLYPERPDATIPQVSVKDPIDFRAESIYNIGYTVKGNRRKYPKKEKDAVSVVTENMLD